jgi:hypothetical protein
MTVRSLSYILAYWRVRQIFPKFLGIYALTDKLGLPMIGSKVVGVVKYGNSHFGYTTKVSVQLPSGKGANYFLKVGKNTTASVL